MPKDVKVVYAKTKLTLYLFISSRTGHEKPCLNLGGPPPKAKHILRSIVNKYSDGKVKRTPGGE